MRKMRKLLLAIMLFLLITFGTSLTVVAANPYLPAWEHIPDGEPRVYDGRVYVYGSHDSQKNRTYCGYEYVSWSAPIDDLNNWEYHGESFNCGGLLYAPDAIKKGDKYYLYTYCLSHGNHVAVSDKPQGPFTTINQTRVGADPAVLVDDDGRVYAYWGYGNCYGAELDPNDMSTIIPGTQINDMIPSWRDSSDDTFHFYEAASMRKVEDKYVLVYCQKPPMGSDSGVIHTNYRARLVYAYSDGPLGPWTYGGTIIDNGGELLPNGKLSYPDGNNHGGMIEINGQWHIFYHRMTNKTEYSRQAMVEPINVRVENDKVLIDEVEMTSQGFETDGLDAYKEYSASVACYLTEGAYITTAYEEDKDYNPITNLKNGCVAGVKYLDFGAGVEQDEFLNLTLDIKPKGAPGTIEVVLDNPDTGTKIGEINIEAGAPQEYIRLSQQIDEVVGKHAVFFVFSSESSGEICEINHFEFSKEKSMYEEKFDSKLPYWNSLKGAPYVQDNAIVLPESSVLQLKHGKGWTDYSVSTRVKDITGQGEIRFRWSDENNYYSLQFDENSIELTSNLFGRKTKLASVKNINTKGTILTISCVEDEIIVKANNRVVMSVQNSHHNTGTIGLVSTSGGNVSISSLLVMRELVKQNVQVDSIFVDGEPLGGFNTQTFSYEFPVSTGEIPIVSGTSTNQQIGISVEQAKTIPGISKVRFLENGTIREYTILFYVDTGDKISFANRLPDGWTVINPANGTSEGGIDFSDKGTTIAVGADDLPKTKNMLQMDKALTGDWIIDTKIELSEPIRQGYQQYGVVIYNDDKNLIRFNNETGGGDSRMQILWWSDGNWQTNNVSQKAAGTSYYMRLKKTGNLYEALFSDDGVNFTHVHTIETDGRFEDGAKLTLYATRQKASNTQYKATVEYVEITPLAKSEGVGQDQLDVEQAAQLLGNKIVLPATSRDKSPSEIAEQIEGILLSNSDIQPLNVQLAVEPKDDSFVLVVKKGATTHRVYPFAVAFKASLAELEQLIDIAENLVKTDYTTASWNKLSFALVQALLIDGSSLDFEVSSCYNRLTDALGALEEINNLGDVIRVKGVNSGGYTNEKTLEIVIKQDIGLALDQLTILKNGNAVKAYNKGALQQFLQSETVLGLSVTANEIDNNYVITMDMSELSYGDGAYQIVADFSGQNRAFRFISDRTPPEIIYNKSSKRVQVRDENLDFVTVNGVTMPLEFTLSGTGEFTIIAMDKAGNQSAEKIILAVDPEIPVIPPVKPEIPPTRPLKKPSEGYRSTGGSSKVDSSPNIKKTEIKTKQSKTELQTKEQFEKTVESAFLAGVEKAKTTGVKKQEVVIALTNIERFTPEMFTTIMQRAKALNEKHDLELLPKVQLDKREGNHVLTRLTISLIDKLETETFNGDILLNQDPLYSRFTRYYKNPLATLELPEIEGYNTVVEIAILGELLPFSEGDIKGYYYNSEKNSYTEFIKEKPYFDTNGYLRFNTNKGGAIILSDRPFELRA